MEKANRSDILLTVTVVTVSLPQMEISGNENLFTSFRKVNIYFITVTIVRFPRELKFPGLLVAAFNCTRN